MEVGGPRVRHPAGMHDTCVADRAFDRSSFLATRRRGAAREDRGGAEGDDVEDASAEARGHCGRPKPGGALPTSAKYES